MWIADFRFPAVKFAGLRFVVLIVAFFAVFLTSLTCHIVLRLAPTILNFNLYDYGPNMKFYCFFFIAFAFGAMLAFLFDVVIGPVVAILIFLVIEFFGLTYIADEHSTASKRRLCYLFAFVAIIFGMLQTSITSFFAKQYTSNLWYGQLNHFHLYLLVYFTAYLCAVKYVALRYSDEVYGLSDPPINVQSPLKYAIFCTVLAFGVVLVCKVFMFLAGADPSIYSSKLKLLRTSSIRMKIVIFLFLPWLFFWILATFIEQCWMVQCLQMYTKMRHHEWELIRAIIICLCIPIACLIPLNGNDFLRMILGGILILCSVICSSCLAYTNVIPFRNISMPNKTQIYGTQTSQRHTFFVMGDLAMVAAKYTVSGPYYIKSNNLNKNSRVLSNDNRGFTFAKGFPRHDTGIVLYSDSVYDGAKPISEGAGKLSMTPIPERNFRSLSGLPLLRIYSHRESQYMISMRIVGGEPHMNFTWTVRNVHIMEIVPGNFNVSYGKYNWGEVYFRHGGYYNLFVDKQAVIAVSRIPGYELNLHCQVTQYCLYSLGKILILSSGLEITFALADRETKCSLIGIFWGYYYLAQAIFYPMYHTLNNYFANNFSRIYINMAAAIFIFFFLYYALAYKMTETILRLGDSSNSLSSDGDSDQGEASGGGHRSGNRSKREIEYEKDKDKYAYLHRKEKSAEEPPKERTPKLEPEYEKDKDKFKFLHRKEVPGMIKEQEKRDEQEEAEKTKGKSKQEDNQKSNGKGKRIDSRAIKHKK